MVVKLIDSPEETGEARVLRGLSDVPENKICVAIFIWCLMSSVLRLSSLSSLLS